MRRRMTYGRKPDANTILLLHGEDFADSSANNHTITYNNVTINTSGKFKSCFQCAGWLNIPYSIFNTINGGEYTIEFFAQTPTIQSSPSYLMLAGLRSTNWQLAYGGISLGIMSTGFEFYYFDSSQHFVSVATAIPSGWYHVAIVRRSGYLYLYINGQQAASVSANPKLNYANIDSRFGNGVSGYYPFSTKYIDELRISNIARYTGNFTPPVKPF